MKKLRIIVTSVVVLAIVGGAFAFKTKGSAYCVKTGAAGNCTTFKQNFKRTTDAIGGISYRYYPCWEFDKTECTLDISGKFMDQILLTTD